MKTSDRLSIFGNHDDGTVRQIETCLNAGGERAVLCADGHKGYAQPIGGVIGYKDKISVSGVGYDIACGNLAIRTDAKVGDFIVGKVMNDIVEQISFGVGRVNATPVDHELFDDPAWSIKAVAPLKQLAREQLGTVGSGNHYVDIFADENDSIWVGVHFGSRGLGHKTATAFLKAAGAKDGIDVEPCVLDANSEIGADYIACMKLAGRYAYAGREWVARHVVEKILKAAVLEEIHNHHNFAWEEEHFGERLFVVRKGATPAFPGQKGFVGGSMGDVSVILEGVESEKSREALYSTVHGAGRVMSRTEAKGRYDRKTGEQKSVGKISREEMLAWLGKEGVVLRGGDLDEAPQAYRRLPEVLAAHAGTIKIIHALRPLGVAMAGKDIVDPYKD